MSENIGKDIGDNIRAALKASGKTQRWLSEETGIPTGYLSELMNGNQKKRFNIDHLDSIASALGVSIGLIVGSENKDSTAMELIGAVRDKFKDDTLISPIVQSLEAAVKEREEK